jgi:3-deoxy-manno-octulosonate cytidylyltransferase (CMP-KDO synthetase)
VPSEFVVVATDDKRIQKHCHDQSIRVIMTSSTCLTGTDRVAEVAQELPARWYVNVQGDEPFLDPESLRLMINATRSVSETVQVINAYSVIHTDEDFRNVTVPKVVYDTNDHLLYASRAAIPTTKSLQFIRSNRQIGLYAFSKDALQTFAMYGKKTPLEELEDIEILRFIELGLTVLLIRVDSVGIAIDTPDDLTRAMDYMTRHPETT